jgi:serine/threonine protein kinase
MRGCELACRGTPGYYPPEMQHSPATATTATDVYAAAVTVVEMVTGKDLFEHWTQKKLINQPEVCAIILGKDLE